MGLNPFQRTGSRRSLHKNGPDLPPRHPYNPHNSHNSHVNLHSSNQSANQSASQPSTQFGRASSHSSHSQERPGSGARSRSGSLGRSDLPTAPHQAMNPITGSYSKPVDSSSSYKLSASTNSSGRMAAKQTRKASFELENIERNIRELQSNLSAPQAKQGGRRLPDMKRIF